MEKFGSPLARFWLASQRSNSLRAESSREPKVSEPISSRATSEPSFISFQLAELKIDQIHIIATNTSKMSLKIFLCNLVIKLLGKPKSS